MFAIDVHVYIQLENELTEWAGLELCSCLMTAVGRSEMFGLEESPW